MANKFDPRISFVNLSVAEQDTITRFLDRWASVMTPAQRTALAAKRYPKAAAWCAGQRLRRPQDARYRKFFERVADMTPAERKRLELPEVGPRFERRQTVPEFEKEQRAKAAIVARVWPSREKKEEFDPVAYAAEMATKAKLVEEAFPGLARGPFDAEGYRKELRQKVAMLREEMPSLFRKFDPVEYRKEMETKAEIVKEAFPGLADFDPVKYENEMRQKFAISGRLYAKADVERRGTPNERRQVTRLRESGYRLSEAERILEAGGWPAMERLDPGCTEKVWNRWLGEERPRWEARLLRAKEPWELTAGDVARSGLSAAQLSEVAYARKDSPIEKRLEALGIRVERPRPVGDYLEAVTKLYTEYHRSEDKGGFLWLNVPGPMPVQVPVPSLSSWKPKDAVGRELVRKMGMKPWRPFAERVKGEAMRGATLEGMWAAAYGAEGAAARAARVPAVKAIGKALPDIVGLAMQTGQLSPRSALAQAYGAYSLQVGAKSMLLRMGLSAVIAGPLSIVIGLAGLFGGGRQRRKVKKLLEEERRKEAARREAGAARALTYQVGYVPSRVGVRYEPMRRRGAARPFRARYGSSLGLAMGTPTRPARI